MTTPVTRQRRFGVLPLSLTALVLVRILQMRGGASSDEGGLLVVAGQWASGGSSLYGDYWVDRPPLLIALFRLADATGGLLSLRILGILAAVVSVLLLRSTARRVFDERAADWTTVVASALLVTPLYGAVDVNGELVGLPFLALGIRAAVEALLTEDGRRRAAAALTTGAAAAAALLVKQNLFDVCVFAVVLWALALQRRRIDWRRLRDLVGLALLGVLLVNGAVILLSLARGTGPVEVFEATYPFRIKAAEALAATDADGAGIRSLRLGLAFLLSAGPFVLGAFVALCLRRRSPEVSWALAAAAAWAAFSAVAGGSYWLHYLIESVPVVALAAGAVSTVAPSVIRVLVGVTVVSALAAAAVVVVHPTPTPGTAVGDALNAAADPGDTVVSLFGDPEILRSADLPSPYPYLWSLPSRALDPQLTELTRVLTGPEAPTWVVVRGPRTFERLEESGATGVLDARFERVGSVCGRTIFLRRGLERGPVEGHGRCAGLDLP